MTDAATIEDRAQPRPDLCPLVPEHLRVILVGLQLIAAQVGELQRAQPTEAQAVAVLQRFRAAFACCEWIGGPFAEEDATCLWCRSRESLGHAASCAWVRLMRDSARWAA